MLVVSEAFCLPADYRRDVPPHSKSNLGCPFFASNKKMRNEAKQSEKDAKTNSKHARGSETKQNKVRLL
jgi:hypothetical protein